MSLKRLAVFAAVALSAGTVAAVGQAGHTTRFAADGVVPLFCGIHFTFDDGTETSSPVYTISSTTPLTIRLGWSVKNEAQMTQFLNGQKLVWTITDSDGNVVLDRTTAELSPEYGDTTYWGTPFAQTIDTVDKGGRAKREKVYTVNYRVATGLLVPAGETYTIAHTLTANTKTDDGFGFAFDAFQPISNWNGCTVTGV
jgi:hypothetical protein